MKPRDALKLRALVLLYGVARGMAFLFESPRSRRYWTLFLIPAAIAYGAIVFTMDGPRLPSPPKATSSRSSSLPFIESFNPVRSVGDVFGYEEHPGYQVPMTFRFVEPLAEIASATLRLEARVRTRRHQLQGTEAIWIDGVLSGKPYPHFVNWRRVSHDETSNLTFVERLDDCCRRKAGSTRYTLDELLSGSGLSLNDVLDDGELEVVIGDDTEILSAELTVCEVGARRCTVVRPEPR